MKADEAEEIKDRDDISVDRGLIAMFLKMTPEERIRANDNAVRTVRELRDAFSQKQDPNYKSGNAD
jgi:hypothetical protein